MTLILLALGLVAAISAELEEVGNESITIYYHENYGIPEAERIKASESAPDYNGHRITGGSSARLGQFPFMGGLLISVPQGRSVCGSTLISNTRALTAAHCWDDGRTQARELTIILGSITLYSGGTRINSNNVVVHPEWDYRTLTNDVAVIRISHVGFTDNIKSIGLASGSNQFAGVTATAVGFGLKGDNANIAPNQSLSYVHLDVISNDVCRRSFRNVIDSKVCTSGANGRSICFGDSGGPLFTGNTLIGISCFVATAGCTRGYPAGFTRVSSFNNWIKAQ